jgi:hypothetical protein
VLFELGARPHPPRELYRAYLAQSDVFIGLYWQRYGQVNPGMAVSGLEEEFELAGGVAGTAAMPTGSTPTSRACAPTSRVLRTISRPPALPARRVVGTFFSDRLHSVLSSP